MTKFITTDTWRIGIIIVGIMIYMAWTEFVVTTDRPVDYYVYVIATHAFGNGENIYTANNENIYTATDNPYSEIAQKLGITSYTFGPYQYPILTALVVYPLTFLSLRVGAAIWVGLSGLAALASALILSSLPI